MWTSGLLRTICQRKYLQDQIQQGFTHWGYAMRMSPLWAPGPNDDETAVHGCRFRSGDMAMHIGINQ